MAKLTVTLSLCWFPQRAAPPVCFTCVTVTVYTAKACRPLSSCSVCVPPLRWSQHLIDSPLLFPYEGHLTHPLSAMLNLTGRHHGPSSLTNGKASLLVHFPVLKGRFVNVAKSSPALLAASVSSLEGEPWFGLLLIWELITTNLLESQERM